jgi:predicted nuclease of predicted toxin-antitoxin system
MKFIVDAQLPRRLAMRLKDAGHDAIHTLDLPRGNRTPDNEINELSLNDQRIVITKDEEFVNRFLITHKPYKLLLISTGNISNDQLEAICVPRISKIVSGFQSHDFIELTRVGLVIHI